MELIEYPDRDMMMIDLAQKLAGDLNRALKARDRALLAVPGGTTPAPIFEDLCAANLDWDRVDVMLTDERWVEDTHPRSNTRLLRRHLLKERAAAATLVPLWMAGEDPEQRVAELEAEIAPRLPINVLLLGMGADMHTASLFPGGDRLEEALARNAPVLVPMRAGGAEEPRVTLSAHVLNGAIAKHIVITGPEKRAALERARGLSPMEAPVNAVLQDATVHWAE